MPDYAVKWLAGVVFNILLNLTANKLPARFHDPVLRWGWFATALYFTYLILTVDAIEERLLMLGTSKISYVIAAIVGAAVAAVYWGGINAVHSKVKKLSEAENLVAATPSQPPPSEHPFREKTDDEVVFLFGSNDIHVPTVLLGAEPVKLPISQFVGSTAFNAIGMSMKDGKPLADVKMWGNGEGDYAIQILHNEFQVKRSNDLDRNYNDRAFEVVNRGEPILQIYYKGKNEIVINGVFEDPFGTVYVTDEGIKPVKILGPTGKVVKPRPLAPIFKYPSVKYLGEINPEWEPGKVAEPKKPKPPAKQNNAKASRRARHR